jgi:hypothetical protein
MTASIDRYASALKKETRSRPLHEEKVMHHTNSTGFWSSKAHLRKTGAGLIARSVLIAALALALSAGLASAAIGPMYSLGYFGENHNWDPNFYPRVLADVDGDGDDDIVGFSYSSTYVSRSHGGSFEAPTPWTSYFAYHHGWRVDRHPRTLADVNGDGKADVVGFGDAGAWVSLSTGSSFKNPQLWVGAYGYGPSGGYWRVGLHPRFVTDMNDDGKADVVGFGGAGVYVSLSTGKGFTAPKAWVYNAFDYNGGWGDPETPRMLADVNDDGLPDVVGFGRDGVWVSLSIKGKNAFQKPSRWTPRYGYSEGWRTSLHPRTLADVNGDGRADVVGFANAGVYVALSTGEAFEAERRWIPDFGYWDGWRVDRHPRIVQDVNGDGMADIVAFGNDNVGVSYSDGQWFGPTRGWASSYGYDDGWRLGPHIRTLGQMDGDPLPEIVAFGPVGVEVFDDFPWTLVKRKISGDWTRPNSTWPR